MEERTFYYKYRIEIPSLIENDKNADRRTQSVTTIATLQRENTFSTTTATKICKADHKNFSVIKVFAGVGKVSGLERSNNLNRPEDQSDYGDYCDKVLTRIYCEYP
ncbi:hypothetical protein GQX74_005626 [Glossina fuscipes]|nr:hypothetical protein GQX74_005626 [Glossina fuscipes]